MAKNKKALIAKFICVSSVVPALMWAHSAGPSPGYTGAPGDQTCKVCHSSSALTAGGDVTITAPNGSAYTPGASQQLTITITDSAQKSWGFQITGRLASDLKNGQAGDFSNIDSNTQVLCLDGNPKGAGKSCPSQFPLQYAEQSINGYRASKGTVGTYSYKVDWKAPATDVGGIMFYVSANASNGTDSQSAGHIYTSTLKLSPPGAKPTINSTSGVVNGATSLATGIAPNTYITIFGSNLATNTRIWAGSDFGASGTQLPTSLDGTSVQINGKAAYVEYISPTQINAITPPDTATGSGITVAVTTGGQASDPATVTLNSIAPGFFTFDGKYVAAADAVSGAFIGKTGLFASNPSLTAPAKPGQTVTLYGTGFGPTSPAMAAGQVTDKLYNLSPFPVITVGDSPAAVGFAGLTPGFAQVYQFNVTIPANAPDGDLKIFAQTGGVTSSNTDSCCYITVKK